MRPTGDESPTTHVCHQRHAFVLHETTPAARLHQREKRVRMPNFEVPTSDSIKTLSREVAYGCTIGVFLQGFSPKPMNRCRGGTCEI